MDTIRIQRVSLSDLDVLQQISRETFSETFSSKNSAENMKKYLEENLSVSSLKEALNDTDSEFYFAILNERVIGYSKLNFGKAQTEINDKKALEIERIYVLSEFHGKKVGKILLENAIEKAIQLKLDYMWLGVWEENPRAIQFYKKNGFTAFDQHSFILGDDQQTDILMKRHVTVN